MRRLRTDDMVEVITGNDRGKRGRILRVLSDKERVVVQGVNLRWKHLRRSQKNPKGGRVRREVPVHWSNVMLYDEEAGARTRIGAGAKDGRKVRIGRKTGKEIGAAAPGSAKARKAEKAEKPKRKRTKKDEE